MPITIKDIQAGRDPLLEALNKPSRQRAMRGHSPHYSLGEAIAAEEGLAGTALKNHGGYVDGAPMKQANQSEHPDRARRAATALEMQIAANKEAEKIANAGA
jgi:hypothetical protein